MRRLAPVGLILVGLALSVPAAARAGSDPSSEGHHARHLCPRCQMLEAQRQGSGGPVVVTDGTPVPGCAACAAMAGGTVVGATVPVGAEAPGVATLGGSRVLSTEPAPIDVVRASYATGTAPNANAMVPPVAAARPGLAPMATGGPMIPAAPTGWVPRPAKRPSVLAHLFGLDGWGRRAREEADHAASRHAAIPIGAPAGEPVSELPASVVFGR